MKLFKYNISITKDRRDVNGVKTQVPNAIVRTDGEDSAGGLGLLFNRYGKGSADNISAFFRGVNLIADSIASMPIQVRHQDEEGYKTVVFNHYLYDCFNHNESLISRFDMIKMLIWSVIMRGNGYIYLTRNSEGKVNSLRWLHPDDVTIYYNKYKNELWYRCEVVSKKRIEPVNMIHIKIHSTDGITGRSILSYAGRSVELANDTENAAINFFKSGCNLNGLIKSTGVLSPQQKQDIRDSWRESLDGSGLAVLQGNLDYVPIQQTVADSKVIENRQFTVVDIARWLGISPVLLGDLTHSSYSTLEASQLEFYTHTLQPYVTLIEEEMTNKIFVPSEQGFSINFDETSVLRADKGQQSDYYCKLLEKGALSINEVRRALGYKPVEGGDIHMVSYSDPVQNAVENVEKNKDENKNENDANKVDDNE